MCERVLPIISPASGAKEYFRWLPCKDGEIKDENSEIVDVIGWIVEDIDDLSSNKELRCLVKNVDRSSFAEVANLCSIYNKTILQLIRRWEKCGLKPAFLHRKASRPHVQFILYQCYNRAVAEPDKLNQYPPFSPQVYGETSFELICQMIDTVKIASEDYFIDLGSGVGQVVLQVAACSEAKFCYGIEKAEYPALCASRLDMEFQRWMDFYGKSYCPYMLERGDFLSSECQERITSATVLFANNFAFGPEVDHQLKQRFANLKEGARIISSKAFCPLNFRITDRNLGDIGSIMHVSCLNPIQDAVSWTDKPFSYYVHTIDRSLLERYFSRLKNPKLKDDAEVVRRDRKGRIISEQTSKEDGATIKSVHPKTDRSRSFSTTRRNRRSKSLNGAVSGNHSHSRTLRSNGHSLGRTANGTLHRHRRSKYHHHRLSRSRKLKPPARSVSLKSKPFVAKSTSSGSPQHSPPLGAKVRNRLAALSLASTVPPKDTIQRSSSFPAIATNCSGHTTPSGSTSIASSTLSNEECSTLMGTYAEVDKHPRETGSCYSPDAVHIHSGYPPATTSWTSSSSSFASSISSANARSPVLLPDETIIPLGPDTLVAPADGKASPSLTNGTSIKDAPNEDRGPIRLTVSLSNKTVNETNSTSINGDATNSDLEANTSVAKRRAVRKCRQLINSTGNPTAPSTATGEQQQKRVRGSLRKLDRLSGARIKNAKAHLHAAANRAQQTALNQTKSHLNALHDEVISQIDRKPCAAFGRNHPAMSSFTAHYQSCDLRSLKEAKEHSDVTSDDANTGCTTRVVPLALTQFLELSKRMFMDHFDMFQSPAYVSNVRHQLALEQARQAKLLEHTRSTEEAIAKLHADGTELLHRFTKRLGILISTPSAFFAQARKLIKHHHTLEAKISEYRKQVAELSAANQDLVRRHQVEAARLLSTALNTTMSTQQQCHDLNHSAKDGFSRSIGTTGSLSEAPLLTTVLNNIPPPPALTKSYSRAQTHFSSTEVHPSAKHPHANTTTSSMWSNDDHPPTLLRLHEPLEEPQIPPPPPLLPMHTPLSPPSTAPILIQSTSISPSHVSVCNSTLSSPNKTSSNLFSLGFHSRQSTKSMHASLQDLIADEFSKQQTCKPSSPQHSTPHFALPPRKRAWDSTYPDQPNGKTPRISSLPATAAHRPSTNLSPPTLSPVELRPPTQCGYEAEHPLVIPQTTTIQRDNRDNRHTINNLSSSNNVPPPPPLLYSSQNNYTTYSEPCETSSPPPPALPSIPVMIAQTLGP